MYYHYTNRRGAMEIRSSGYLLASEGSGAFGSDVYLTDLDPREFFRNEILVNNYGGIRSEFHNRADWVVKILESDIFMHLLRQVHVPGENDRRIFVYPNFIMVYPDQIMDKPRCLKSYVVDDYDTSTNDTDDTEAVSSESESEHRTDASDTESLSDECEIEKHENSSAASEKDDASSVSDSEESGNDEGDSSENSDCSIGYYEDYDSEDFDYGSEDNYYED